MKILRVIFTCRKMITDKFLDFVYLSKRKYSLEGIKHTYKLICNPFHFIYWTLSISIYLIFIFCLSVFKYTFIKIHIQCTVGVLMNMQTEYSHLKLPMGQEIEYCSSRLPFSCSLTFTAFPHTCEVSVNPNF